MDEFRKPYEYTEEKRGYVLAFVIMLVSLDFLLALFYTVQVYYILNPIHALGIGFLFLCLLYIIFIAYTAITCYKLKKNMLRISKAYLIVRAIFTICCIILLFLYNLTDGSVGIDKEYGSLSELILKALIIPLFYVLGFSTGWYLYFKKSKKCKELIKNPSGIK